MHMITYFIRNSARTAKSLLEIGLKGKGLAALPERLTGSLGRMPSDVELAEMPATSPLHNGCVCLQGSGVGGLDRDVRPGVKFADAELLGIPHRVVVGERGLDAGTLEYRHRRATDSEDFAQHAALEFLGSRLQRPPPA